MIAVREYKIDLKTGGKLYAKVDAEGSWLCEIRGAATWFASQKSPDPIWESNRKWDKLPEVFSIEPTTWDEFRQGVQQQEDAISSAPKEGEENQDGITEEITAKAIEILKSGDPVKFFLDTFNKIHVGDRDLGQILLYCTASQLNKTSNGLHPKLSGESGMGKSDAVETFLHCLPKCAYIRTSMSSKAIFYHDIRPGTIIFLDDYKQNDDLDAIIKQTSSRFHEPYEHRTIDKDRSAQIMVAPPEIVWAITSVDTSQDIQVLNRQVGLDVDATEDTTRAVIEHLLAQAERGEERFPVTEDVLICRAMVLEMKKHNFNVVIPFAKRISWTDYSSRRNPSIFLDLVRSNAVWHFMQRVCEEDRLEATEQDFFDAKTLYVGRADTLIDKLSKPERKLAEAILATAGQELYREEAAEKLKVSVNRISQLVHGENGKTGLIQKLPGFNVEKVTIKDEVRNVCKMRLSMSKELYHPLAGYDSVVKLLPPKSGAEDDSKPCKDSVSRVLTDKNVSKDYSSKSVSNIYNIYKEELPSGGASPKDSQKNSSSLLNPKNDLFPYTIDTDSEKAPYTMPSRDLTSEEIAVNEEADRIRDAKFVTPKRCEECGKNATALHEIGQGEFVMRMCKKCYDAYLDDISSV